MKTFILFLIIILLFNQSTFAQESIKGKYKGWWIDTFWKYQFKKDNTFSLKISGHFGDTHNSGIYTISNDTIFLESYRSCQMPVEVNPTFLIDGDSCIIGLLTCMDFGNRKCAKQYREYSNYKEPTEFISRFRSIKFPQTPSSNPIEKSTLITLLNQSFSDSSFLSLIEKNRNGFNEKIAIASYFQIDSSWNELLQIGDYPISIIDEKDITDSLYVKITEINFNPNNLSLDFTVVTTGYQENEELIFKPIIRCKRQLFVRKLPEIEDEEIIRFEVMFPEKFYFTFHKSKNGWSL